MAGADLWSHRRPVDFPRDFCLTIWRNHKIFLSYFITMGPSDAYACQWIARLYVTPWTKVDSLLDSWTNFSEIWTWQQENSYEHVICVNEKLKFLKHSRFWFKGRKLKSQKISETWKSLLLIYIYPRWVYDGTIVTSLLLKKNARIVCLMVPEGYKYSSRNSVYMLCSNMFSFIYAYLSSSENFCSISSARFCSYSRFVWYPNSTESRISTIRP